MYGQIHAIFAEPGDAEKAAGALLDNGALAADLTIIQPQPDEQHATTYEAVDSADGTPVGGSGLAYAVYEETPIPLDEVDDGTETDYEAKHSISTTTAGDAAIGAAKGLGWGAGVGAVAALASLFIPGVGLVIGGGALATAIAGAVAATGAGAVAGAVTGYLKDQGYEEEESKRYLDTVNGGGAVLFMSIPSGTIDYLKACELIEKYKGAPLVKVESRATYLA